MSVTLSIYFDRPHATYFAGETVGGRLVMLVAKPKKFKAVTVQFKGEADVHWTESRSSKKDGVSSSDTYSSHETYFNNTIYFMGGENGEVDIGPGEYVFDFQCLLPSTLPSSFEGAYGHIRYTAKAVMNRPWKFDHGAKAAFTVVAPLDLNALPQARAPIEMEASKHFCCLWCRSGPLTVHARLPAGGYVPGQVISAQIQVDNASSTRVGRVSCSLNKEVKWHARHLGTAKTKVTNNDVAATFGGEVAAHGSKASSLIIAVPAVPPSNLVNCGIIDLQYVLKVTAHVESCHMNLFVRVPLVIGTLPLRSEPGALPPASSAAAAPNAWGDASAPPLHPHLPPPSYEECVFAGNNIMDATDNEYTMGTGDFRPRYPVWALNVGAEGK